MLLYVLLAVGAVVYGQLGWVIGRSLSPGDDDGDLAQAVAAAVFWPIVVMARYLVWPTLRLLHGAVVLPQRVISSRAQLALEARSRAPQPPSEAAPIERIETIDRQIASLTRERERLLERPDARRP